MDHKFTEELQVYLGEDVQKRDLAKGAELLLRCNRNRHMHDAILRKGLASKLDYELKKHLRIRLDGLTIAEVLSLEKEVLPAAEESLSAPIIDADADRPTGAHRGVRADHDKLPAEVKALYDQNGELFVKIKETFEQLKQMHDAQPCDRYDLVKLLAEIDKKYRENWQQYDAYQFTAKTEAKANVKISRKISKK